MQALSALLSALGWLQSDPDTDPDTTIACVHTNGHYCLDREPVWVEPRTEIMVDGEVKVVVEGDMYSLTIHWIENGRPIDDMSGCLPAGLDHYGAVKHWIEALGTRVLAHAAMQDARLLPPNEFTNDDPVTVDEFVDDDPVAA